MKEWIISNQFWVITIGTLLVTVASTIIARTATKKDDGIWEFVKSIAAQLGWLDKEGKFSIPFIQGPVTEKIVEKVTGEKK